MIVCYGSLLRLLMTTACLGYFQQVAAFSTHFLNFSRIKRATCSSRDFTCDDNQCISKTSKCDGITDCHDKSDETAQLCLNLETPCDDYAFQCKYGACIDSQLICNGVQDCADNSDETSCPNGKPALPTKKPPKTVEPTRGCRVPSTASGGQFILPHCNLSDPSPDCIALAGVQLEVGIELTLRCSKGYSLQGTNPKITCGLISGWVPAPRPTCRKACHPLINPNLNIECKVIDDLLNERKVRCDQPMFKGTTAAARCPLYFEQEERRAPIVCREDGHWDKELRECQPLCGYRDQSLKPTIFDGKKANHTEYPWHVALYWSEINDNGSIKYDYKCGGSLISTTVVLTAAHCGYDEYSRTWTSAESMYIALGKQKPDWNDGDKAQRFSVKQFKKPIHYYGLRSAYNFDVALVILDTPVVLTDFVFPVCLDFDGHFKPGDYGKVPGWGKTNDGKDYSGTLLYADIPIMDTEKCLSMLIADNEDRFLTHDKFCGGFDSKGPKVSTGDSGGGLVFKYGKKNYVVGIVSTTLEKENFYVSFYTNVTYHYLWIIEEMNKKDE